MGAALINIIPSILWFALVAVLVYSYRRPIRNIINEASKRITHFKFGPLEVNLSDLQHLIEIKSPGRVTDFANQVLARARRNAESLKGAKILWADDNPSNNFQEAELLQKMGVSTSWATSNQEVLTFLESDRPDLVISDIARGQDSKAGLELPALLQSNFPSLPVIFYVGEFDATLGTPPYAFAITNHPDELLNYVMDVLERVRPPIV
jgi:CheY-like chemotaxis protein